MPNDPNPLLDPRPDGDALGLADATPTPLMQGARIGRRTAGWLTWAFAALMILPMTQELLSHPHPSLLDRSRDDLRKYGLQITLQEAERHLVYDSQFASMVRQPYQRLLVRWLGQGSRSVIIGADGFLFHHDDVQMTTGIGIRSAAFLKEPPRGLDVIDDLVNALLARWKGRPPPPNPGALQPSVDSLDVLSSLDGTLRQRGVHLVVVVVPGKSTIYPEKLWPRYPSWAGPALNADDLEWRAELLQRGVDVVDLSDTLWQAKQSAAEPLFLKQDTHWTPQGVAIGAERVANRVRPFLGQYAPLGLTTHLNTIPEPNDLVLVLGLTPDAAMFPQRPIELTQVLPTEDQRMATGDLAPVLLFGDSLVAYYDTAPVGGDAGLAQQLMWRLHAGVQRFVGFGDESAVVMQAAFDRQPSVLTNKRVVVLEFSAQALYSRRFSKVFLVR